MTASPQKKLSSLHLCDKIIAEPVAAPPPRHKSDWEVCYRVYITLAACQMSGKGKDKCKKSSTKYQFPHFYDPPLDFQHCTACVPSPGTGDKYMVPSQEPMGHLRLEGHKFSQHTYNTGKVWAPKRCPRLFCIS